ncbi:MAG TPA: hypothetical protein VFV93_02450 [Thermomicrobiales bacterium]|nr:hypothetical protein [Thermomicrobiales bacterium]
MDDVCLSPAALTVITAMVSGLFTALIWQMKDSIREARAQRDRALDGWEATVGLGEKAVRRERRRA